MKKKLVRYNKQVSCVVESVNPTETALRLEKLTTVQSTQLLVGPNTRHTRTHTHSLHTHRQRNYRSTRESMLTSCPLASRVCTVGLHTCAL